MLARGSGLISILICGKWQLMTMLMLIVAQAKLIPAVDVCYHSDGESAACDDVGKAMLALICKKSRICREVW